MAGLSVFLLMAVFPSTIHAAILVKHFSIKKGSTPRNTDGMVTCKGSVIFCAVKCSQTPTCKGYSLRGRGIWLKGDQSPHATVNTRLKRIKNKNHSNTKGRCTRLPHLSHGEWQVNTNDWENIKTAIAICEKDHSFFSSHAQISCQIHIGTWPQIDGDCYQDTWRNTMQKRYRINLPYTVKCVSLISITVTAYRKPLKVTFRNMDQPNQELQFILKKTELQLKLPKTGLPNVIQLGKSALHRRQRFIVSLRFSHQNITLSLDNGFKWTAAVNEGYVLPTINRMAADNAFNIKEIHIYPNSHGM